MDGKRIQEEYQVSSVPQTSNNITHIHIQHRVTPTGFRFAATARFIDPEQVENPVANGRWKPVRRRQPIGGHSNVLYDAPVAISVLSKHTAPLEQAFQTSTRGIPEAKLLSDTVCYLIMGSI